MSVKYLAQFAMQEELKLIDNEMVAFIVGPTFTKAIQRVFQNIVFPSTAVEILKHGDPRLTQSVGHPQSTAKSRAAGMKKLPLCAPHTRHLTDLPKLFYHANYFDVKDGQLVVTTWSRAENEAILSGDY